MTTKIPVELSSTPGIVDGSNATAITIDSSENVTLAGDLTLSSATANKPVLTLTDTNADSQGPDLVFRKDSSSPADNDELFRIYGYGDDDAGNATEGFLMLATMTDVSNGSEDTKVRIMTYGAGSQRDTLTLAGLNVGIGTTSPSETLHVKRADGTALIVESSNDQNNTGDRINIEFRTDAAQGIAKIIGGKQGNYQSAGARSGYLAFQTINANSYAERMRITSGDGIVGIGVSDPKSHIHTHIASSGGAYHQFTNASTNANSDDGWKIGIHDDENFIIWGQESSESFRVYNNGAYRLTVDHNGAVSVAGSFSKGSGSFKIDHPLPAKKDTHHLVHSFVEAPQADLIYRGTATLSSGSATVNLDTVAGMTEGTYVLLNTNSSCFTSNETDWDAVKGSVSGNTLTITCQNDSSTATVSWLVIGERHDQHMKDTEWTDDNGKVIVEPLKEEE